MCRYLIQILSELKDIPVTLGDVGHNLLTHPVVSEISK